MSSIVDDRASMRRAKSMEKFAIRLPTWPMPAGIQVKYACCHGAPALWKTIHAAINAARPVLPRANTLVMVLFLGVWGLRTARRPLTSAPSAGSRTTSSSASAIERPHLVDIDRTAEPVELDDDGQADRGLAGGDRNDKYREDLPLQVRETVGEGHEIDVDRIEHQLDAHQHRDH